MILDVKNGFYLSSLCHGDETELVKHLNKPDISEFIPALPFPYSDEMATSWVQHRLNFTEKMGTEISFGLRNPDGYLVGSFGLDDFPVGKTHRAEVGYWLAETYRGQGLATSALQVFISYAFENLELIKLTAHTLAFNTASMHVLKRCGFMQEGHLRHHTQTRNGIYDTLVYGLLKSEIAKQ
jgi:[ribosomal protein S5]-alanine N-acetyltransferase